MKEEKAQEYKNKICEWLANTPGASFAEMERKFPELFDSSDEPETYALYLKYQKSKKHKWNKVLVWLGFTELGCRILNEMFEEDRIRAESADRLLYLIDGKVLNLKEWQPVLLYVNL